MSLDHDFDGLHARTHGSARKRTARKNEAALSRAGDLAFGLPKDKAELHALIDTMFRHQEERLGEKGIHGAFGPAERQFIHRLAALQDEADPILAPYRLTLDGEVLSVMLGGLHGNGYWALISSLAPGPQRKHSPGEIALRRTIAACCAAGLQRFDLSAGDAAYKRIWADDVIDLSIILSAVNLRGLVWTAAEALRLAAKRTVKRTPALMNAAAAVRQLFRAGPA